MISVTSGIILAVVCLILGFTVGFLVYRNNVKRFKTREEELLAEVKAVRKAANDKVAKLKDSLKEKL